VRQLAQESKKAAGEISKLSENSMAVAETAGSLLESIVPDIRKTAELVQEISVAAQEQNTGASQINVAIQQLDQTVQQGASASEEVAATAENLSDQTERMSGAIAYFNVPEKVQGQSAKALQSAAPIRSAKPSVEQGQVRAKSNLPPEQSAPSSQGIELDMTVDEADFDEAYKAY
jgi:methyl-accepting chemotaxis protein